MKDILLSIKTEYAQKILSSEKLFEFRGWIWKKDVNYVYIYASGEIKKIVAKFKIDKILEDTPNNIWSIAKDKAGVSKELYYSYVESYNYNKIFAIKIDNLKILDRNKYISLIDLDIKNAPQKFKYLSNSESNKLERLFNE